MLFCQFNWVANFGDIAANHEHALFAIEDYALQFDWDRFRGRCTGRVHHELPKNLPVHYGFGDYSNLVLAAEARVTHKLPQTHFFLLAELVLETDPLLLSVQVLYWLIVEGLHCKNGHIKNWRNKIVPIFKWNTDHLLDRLIREFDWLLLRTVIFADYNCVIQLNQGLLIAANLESLFPINLAEMQRFTTVKTEV